MIILHLGVYERDIFLWGEKPSDPKPLSPRQLRSGNKHVGPSGPNLPAFLPYNAGVKEISAALGKAGIDLPISKKSTQAMVAWLPTIQGNPLASSSLIAEPSASATEVTLAPWRVTAICLRPAQAVYILCACIGRQPLAPGVIVGKDLSFFATAMRLAGALVARQQFLPGIAKINGHYEAAWTPVLNGPDDDRLAKITKAMPHVCRALTPADAWNEAPCQSPAGSAASILTPFIEEMVDSLVRSAVTNGEVSLLKARGSATLTLPQDSSVHDRWLYSLRGAAGVLPAEEEGLIALADQIQEWQRPIAISAAAPFRLCFRLEEPQEEGTKPQGPLKGQKGGSFPSGPNPWFVRYLLQARDDPSLLILVKDIWKEGRRGAAKGVATVFRGKSFNGQEYLLFALGQAAGIGPQIESSLRKPAPDGFGLDATGAYTFLRETAPGLEQAGFGVMLPAWWTGKGTKLRLTARAQVKSPQMQESGSISLNEIVQFDWQMSLGEENLSFDELQALARLKAPLVKIRGQWVEMSAEEIHAALELWKAKGPRQAPLREIFQMALGGLKAPGNIDFQGVSATGWVGDLMAQIQGGAAAKEIPPPLDFQGSLRPYQIRGYSWLAFLRRWGLGACLADDMGLGKTIQALALIQRDWESTKRPVLLICPTSVVNNWRKEAARFTPGLPVLIHHGLTRAQGLSFKEKALDQAMVISSYALAHRDFATLKEVPWVGVILDEAQNIKNPETKQARAARAIPSDYRIVLTGTPVENNVGDLWSIMEFLNPGFLGTQSEFKRRFFIPIQSSRDEEATKKLKQLTSPFILRRLKTDRSIIDDLPEKMEMKVFCNLTKEQASLYAAVVEDVANTLESAEGIRRKGLILATLSKLKQVCNHPAQFLGDNSSTPGRSGKMARLTEMLEEILSVGDRALVFTQFAEMGKILRRHLQETFGREILFLHGAVPKKQRDFMVERFQDPGDEAPSIFILSLKAGGTGLNLTRANHVFHFDRWWNPAVENQATDRAFRIGQTRNVQVHKFLCAGTLEEKIDEMIERKKTIAERVVGTGEAWLTELSTSDLKELFALRKEATEGTHG